MQEAEDADVARLARRAAAARVAARAARVAARAARVAARAAARAAKWAGDTDAARVARSLGFSWVSVKG